MKLATCGTCIHTQARNLPPKIYGLQADHVAAVRRDLAATDRPTKRPQSARPAASTDSTVSLALSTRVPPFLKSTSHAPCITHRSPRRRPQRLDAVASPQRIRERTGPTTTTRSYTMKRGGIYGAPRSRRVASLLLYARPPTEGNVVKNIVRFSLLLSLSAFYTRAAHSVLRFRTERSPAAAHNHFRASRGLDSRARRRTTHW